MNPRQIVVHDRMQQGYVYLLTEPMGRRGEDDACQIRRWKAVRRQVAQLERNCRPGDLSCRRRQRQALLHWAYDSRKI